MIKRDPTGMPLLARILTLLMAAWLLSGCGPALVDLDGKTMGTYYTVKYIGVDGAPSAAAIQAEIDRRLERVNDQMSTYRPDSELSRFNQSRAVNEAFPVSAETARVVEEALRIHQLTDGALDVTVGPLVNLWGFGPERRADSEPEAAQIAQRRAWVGIQHLSLQGNALVKDIPELYVDLSAIAKGFGVDVVADYLQSLHIDNYMVDIGGEVRTKGHNAESLPWRIAIEKPSADARQRVQAILQPGQMAVATSGDYRNYFEQDGQHFSHEIDPKTGRPVTHALASLTVLAPSCMTADGLSTGLFVMGPERAMALANRMNIPLYMIVKGEHGFEVRTSTALAAYLVAPTP